MANQIILATGDAAAIVPEIWSGLFTSNLNDAIVLNSLISRDYENEIKNLGDIVKIPSIGDVVAQNLPEGAAGQSQGISASTQDLTINKRSYVDFEITDQAQLQAVSFTEKIRTLAFAAIMRLMQDDLFSDVVPSTSAPDHTIDFDSGTTLADADLLEILDLAEDANWPAEGRHLVVGPRQKNDVLAITKFVDKDTNLGSSPTASGQITEPIYGDAFAWTTAAGAQAFKFHESFMQMAVQKELQVKLFDKGVTGERSDRLNIDILWGNRQVHNDRVIVLS